ncbi:hypothetical protein ACHAXA_011093 [Cyclostephanos tholiformis]|uniref:Uncharacterized protein n=1 Tax=Cyclostephanos tholiformis TaxID=382380 RepID=A0ABD3SFT6_9STRA
MPSMGVSCGEGCDRSAAAADDQGLEHANRIIRSILHQITEGDAPSGNFENDDKVHILVGGNISTYARQGSGMRSLLLSSHSNASDSKKNQSDDGNDVTSMTEGSDYSTGLGFPPRSLSSSSQKNDVSDASNPFLCAGANVPSYSIGACLLGAIPLANLCSWSLQSSSSNGRREGGNSGMNYSNSDQLFSLELEDSTTRDDEQKSSIYDQSNINRRSDNASDNNPTPRLNNGGNARFFAMNTPCDDQGFPMGNGFDGDDQLSNIDRMDTCTISWNNKICTFNPNDFFGEMPSDGMKKEASIENGPASRLPTHECASSGDSGGSKIGRRRHLTMFGSEYARILSISNPVFPSPTEPTSTSKMKRSTSSVSNKIMARFSSSVSVAQSFASSAKEGMDRGSELLSLDECPNSVATAAITDVIITSACDIPPKGYYRAFQLGEESVKNTGTGRTSQRLFFNVKKEPSWERAAQRPCVTAFCVIYPDRNEFVPPGFSVVRHYQPGGSRKKEESSSNNNSELGSSVSPAANINPSSSGERIYICYRRSREGNPVTGVTCLRPAKGDLIPEGYTVLERTPRNFVADLAARVEQPLLLAYRQRLENLECLRPLPLVLSVLRSKTKELNAYYCTGGTVVQSDVGRYHIMDRSTHTLMSTSSAKNRLNLIQSSREESEIAVPSWVGSASAHPPSQINVDQNLRHADSSFQVPGQKVDPIETSRVHQTTRHSGYSISSRSQQSNPSYLSPPNIMSFGHSDDTLQAALETMHFIPVVECAQIEDAACSDLQSRMTAITPILTACYISHGASSLVAIEGLTSMLNETNFFANDFTEDDCNTDGSFEASARLTILDLTIQAVCDVATCSARETYFRACVDFVSDAVRYAGGKLNDRTVGFVLRFYLFVFYFGASIPTQSWPFNKEGLPSAVAIRDDFLLSDAEQNINFGAPQAAAIALKELVSIMLSRVGTGLDTAKHGSIEFTREDAVSPQHFHNNLSNPVERAVVTVDVVTYTQLAMYQIYRSGGSELLWHDLMNSIGEGIFGKGSTSYRGAIHSNIISFSILATIVKICSGKVKMISQTDPVPRDVASKLLGFELLLHFIRMWHVAVSAEDVMRYHHAEEANLALVARQNFNPMTYAIRRLVVPTLLSNTSSSIENCQVYRRILRIITQLWCNPYYRCQMKIELAVLIEHFVLKLLLLEPQVHIGSASGNDGVTLSEGMPSLIRQQLDVLEELKLWFSSNTKDALDLYISYENDGMLHGMLPPSYCRIMNKMCEALCTLAEKCGTIISEHGRFASINGGTGSSRRPALFPRENSALNNRESAQTMRQKSFDAITAIAKSMMDCASISSHKGWTAESGLVDPNDDNLFSENDSFDGLGLSPRLIPVLSFESENIIDYWRTSIEKRKAPLLSLTLTSSSEIETPTSFRIMHSMSQDSSKQASLHEQEIFDVAFELIATKGLKKGIDFLIASRILTSSPRQISTFLRIHLSSIDSGLLGDYLGEGGIDGADADFFNLVRFNFARATSFVGMNIEQALRHYLTNCGFRLPGEAQKIDRIISTFSQCYWEDNAGDLQKCPFQNQDTVFLVSFAIIMLNTDLHKTQVSKGKFPKRMTKNEFMNNLRGVDDGVDKFRDYIYSIYDSIESMPIVISTSPTLIKRSKQNDTHYSLPSKDPTNLSSSIHNWVRSVEPAQELLRTFAVQHDKFQSLDDQLLQDVARQMFSANWHHIHGAINATIDNAHLDLAGLDCCMDAIEHSLRAASYLGMAVERSAFNKLLCRVTRFRDLNERNKEVDGETKINAMKQVASRIRNGDILLNDTSRCYVREGDLVKHHQLAARTSTYRFFLFSDVLVYTHVSKEGDYKVHEELPLHLMKIDDSESQGYYTKQNSFHIHHPNKSFLVTCADKTEKKQWMEDINTSIRREVKRKAAIEKSRIEAARRAASR